MSLEPAKHNFVIWRGASFYTKITYYSDATETTPTDLTGYSASLVIRDKPGGTELLTLSTQSGGIILGTIDGAINLTMPADQTAALTWTSGVYTLMVTSPSPVTDVLLYGGFAVRGI